MKHSSSLNNALVQNNSPIDMRERGESAHQGQVHIPFIITGSINSRSRAWHGDFPFVFNSMPRKIFRFPVRLPKDPVRLAIINYTTVKSSRAIYDWTRGIPWVEISWNNPTLGRIASTSLRTSTVEIVQRQHSIHSKRESIMAGSDFITLHLTVFEWGKERQYMDEGECTS